MGEEELRVRADSKVSDLGHVRRWCHQYDREQHKREGYWEVIEKVMNSVFYMWSQRSLWDVLEMCSWQLDEWETAKESTSGRGRGRGRSRGPTE